MSSRMPPLSLLIPPPDADSGQVIALAGKFKEVRGFLHDISWERFAPEALKTDAFHPRRGPGSETWIIIFVILETAKACSEAIAFLKNKSREMGNPVIVRKLSSADPEVAAIYERMKTRRSVASSPVRTIIDPNEKPPSAFSLVLDKLEAARRENDELTREIRVLDAQIGILTERKMSLAASRDTLQTLQERERLRAQ